MGGVGGVGGVGGGAGGGGGATRQASEGPTRQGSIHLLRVGGVHARNTCPVSQQTNRTINPHSSASVLVPDVHHACGMVPVTAGRPSSALWQRGDGGALRQQFGA